MPKDITNARLKIFQRTTKESVEEFKEKRSVASNTFKKKRGNGKMGKWKTVRNSNNFKEKETKKYYKEVKDIKAGFQPRVIFCRDKEGKLIADRGKVTDRWVEYFSDLSNKDTADEEGEENIEGENYICLPPPTLEEVKEQIETTKNNIAPGED
jgi:hypothetical protein